MQYLADKVSRPVKLVVDPFSGTFATAKECLKLLPHRCFGVCKVVTECFAASTKVLAETHAGLVLNDYSVICCTDKAAGACKKVVRAFD